MRFGAAFAIAVIAALLSWPAFAANEPAAGTESAAPEQQSLSHGELDALVAPIALYPDALLAQVLMAATYPLEAVQADRFAKANTSLKGDKLDEALAKLKLKRSIALTTPGVLAVPFVLRRAPVITTMPSRLARYFAEAFRLAASPAPVELPTFTISLPTSAE